VLGGVIVVIVIVRPVPAARVPMGVQGGTMLMFMLARVVVGRTRVNRERDAGTGVCRAFEMHMEIPNVKLRKFPFETGWIDAQIGERAHELISIDLGLTFDA
jgi:hypothetical protein